jgi:predicted nuclease of predicted toxin-antitoxin system
MTIGTQNSLDPMADLFLDADIDSVLVAPFEARGHSVQTTAQVSRHNATDIEQLLIATDLGRLLITHDRDDYLLLCRLWRALALRWGVSSETHAGVLIVPQAAQLPLPRIVSEIDGLIRSEPSLWGRVFRFDLKWGWMPLL